MNHQYVLPVLLTVFLASSVINADNPIKNAIGKFNPFSHVGAIASSSKFLAKKITANIYKEAAASGPLMILEIGPGDGVFTAKLERHLAKHGIQNYMIYALDIDSDFIKILEKRFVHNKRIKVMNADIGKVANAQMLELPAHTKFDVIISGLPFYADFFNAEQVDRILTHYQMLLKPNGLLRWFSYIGIKTALNTCLQIGSCVSTDIQTQVDNLAAKNMIIETFKNAHNVRSKKVYLNTPPAWVHECRMPVIV